MSLLRCDSEYPILFRLLCPGKDALGASVFPFLVLREPPFRDVLHMIALAMIFIIHHGVPLIPT